MMMEYWAMIFAGGFLFATVMYVVALRIQVMALVDVLWSFGVGLGAVCYLCYLESLTLRSWVVVSVLLLWSLRLSLYLLVNRVLAAKEDPRYVHLASYWGRHAKRNFYLLFVAQILLVALFVLPVTIALGDGTQQWRWWDGLGLAVAALALVGEGLADRQLAHFRSQPDNHGKVCQVGLWRYSRHPNYFFEWLYWWAFVLFACGQAGAAISLVGPVAMYLFLNYITGIPHAERSSLKSRGEAYRRYQQTTNTFFPWIPRQPQL
jgi:steroid 5-alpha reductase family enzyme